MKKITVMLSLLFTAILCFMLASCDSKISQKEEATSAATTAEETTTAKSNSAEETSAPESSTANTTNKASSETTGTTKPATTATKPTTTTANTTTTKPLANASDDTTASDNTTVPVEIDTQSSSTTVSVSDSEDTDFETQIINSVNAERKSRGLPELSYSAELSDAAKIRAKELSVSYGSLRPNGGGLSISVSPIARGENISKDHTSPQEVMDEWMASEGHRKNILEDTTYKTIGVGYYYDSETDTYYWVQLFGI